MSKQIFEEVIIKIRAEERAALLKFGNAIGADLSDVIRGFILYLSTLGDFTERLESIIKGVNTISLARKLREQTQGLSDEAIREVEEVTARKDKERRKREDEELKDPPIFPEEIK